MRDSAQGPRCTPREREVLDMIKAWPDVPATVTYSQNGRWSVATDTDNAEAYMASLPEAEPPPNCHWPNLPAPATEEEVQAKYIESGLTAGWTLFACPKERLLTAGYAVIALNPAGGGPKDTYPYNETWECPGGNAYQRERWGSDGESYNAMQNEVLAWHKLINVDPSRTLAAYFSPFRTPNEETLWQARGDLFGFSEKLWGTLLPHSAAHTFFAMGKTVGRCLERLLSARHVGAVPVDWGACTIRVALSPEGKRVVTMPHPSRYKLFGSKLDHTGVRAESFMRVLSLG